MEKNDIIEIDLSIFEQRSEFEVIDVRALRDYANEKGVKIEDLSEEEKNQFFEGIYSIPDKKIIKYNPNYYKRNSTK